MKRIFIALLLLLLVPIHTPAAASLPFEGQYSFYCAEVCADARCSSNKFGSGYEISCSSDCADEIRAQLKDICGESVSFCGNKNDFLKAANSLGSARFYEAGGVLVAEGYCAALRGGITKDGKTLNFQAAYDNGIITVGTPLILGGF